MNTVQPIRDKAKLEAMKKYLRGTNLRDYVLFSFGINSGLRVSDLLKLKVCDVYTDKGKSIDRLEVVEKKTGKVKEFPLGVNVRKALEEYYPQCSDETWLFPSRKGCLPIDRRHAWTILSNAASAVGINDRIGTHTLRKTFGYWAFKQGADITLIQKLLNHSYPSITLAYIGITKDEMDEVYLTLNL